MARAENDDKPNHGSPSITGNPEDLHELRTAVEDWLKNARDAVWFFEREDGSFQSDSKTPHHSSITTTARCYMALAYAERQLGKEPERDKPQWRKTLASYLQNLPVKHAECGFKVTRPKNEEGEDLNNFEIAHLADFEFVRKFATRFGGNEDDAESIEWLTKEEWKDKDALRESIGVLLKEKLDSEARTTPKGKSHEHYINYSEVPFIQESDSSRHYFVTLHALRALSILDSKVLPSREALSELAENARRFCVEQCFFCQRGIRHLQDSARLVFASLIYCMYAEEVDREIMVAIVEAIASMQEPSGKWPASHPIVREKKKGVWYIASAELALCLTWLYFQPALPDVARRIVLEILERHFRNWIVPTYRRAPGEKGNAASKPREFYGWFDDSAMGQQKVVGWATAIVCHFLANYDAVLNDHINKTVIESLGLQGVAKCYLVDKTAPNRNSRWKGDVVTNGEETSRSENPWPDLPPIAWSENVNKNELAEQIWRAWTDPEPGAALARRLATSVLVPILSVSRCRPEKMVAGILDGPPGTRKTSLVEEISKILQWPYVPVPASTIFDRGFDNMEARGSEVFRRLNYLTQCVIFFDEFEEFFRDRKESSSHDRTIAAFTTSAMLPRIQDLRNEERSLIFLATNHFDNLDSAIVRVGRFDFRETIDHPTIKRFDDSDIGYLSHPTKITLAMLNISAESDELKLIKEAISKALRSDTLECPLEKLQNVLKEEGASCEPHADTENRRIKFGMIEKAAKELVDVAEGDKKNKKILEEKAAEVIKNEIEKVIRQKKGPEPLPNGS